MSVFESQPNPTSPTVKTNKPAYQIMVPEELIADQVQTLVSELLHQDKIDRALYNSVYVHRSEVIKELREEVVTKTTQDFQEIKERIIEDFLQSKRTEIYLDGKVIASVKDATAHHELPKLLTFLQLFQQALIVGPTGSGKSTLAKQAATALKQRYGSFSCNMEASKSELVGFANLNGYVTSQFLDFYENGGVFLVDEYDAMSPSIAVVLNAVFDRTGQISVPNRTENPIAKKHPNFYCILAGNTWGSGSVEYQGREMQDMAFLDRFKMCRIVIDYDQRIEKEISGKNYTWFQSIRTFMAKTIESEKFSTRSMYDASVLLKNGSTKEDIVNMISFHWEPEITKKLKEAVLPTPPKTK